MKTRKRRRDPITKPYRGTLAEVVEIAGPDGFKGWVQLRGNWSFCRGHLHDTAEAAEACEDLRAEVSDLEIRTGLRVGWASRHREVIRKITFDLDFARSVANGTHPRLKRLRGALEWGHAGKTYEEFAAWRSSTVEAGKVAVPRIKKRLVAIEAMENPWKEPRSEGQEKSRYRRI